MVDLAILYQCEQELNDNNLGFIYRIELNSCGVYPVNFSYIFTVKDKYTDCVLSKGLLVDDTDLLTRVMLELSTQRKVKKGVMM